LELKSDQIKTDERSKHIYLKPDYIFQGEICEKIKRLKDVFLQFDNDKSNKFDIPELLNMFHDNNIPVTQLELMDLFFKKKEDKKQKHKVEFIREDDFEIDFKKLVEFATNENYQKRFEDFMRMIKKRDLDKKSNLQEKIRLKKERAINNANANFYINTINNTNGNINGNLNINGNERNNDRNKTKNGFNDTNEFSDGTFTFTNTNNNISFDKDITISTNFNLNTNTNLNANPNNNNNNKNIFMPKSGNLMIIKEEKKIAEDKSLAYYPFTFNKILEHFNRKGKIKENLDKIRDSIVK
jgi:hypothetical protein